MSEYNLKSFKKKFKEQGIFYTPPEQAEMVKKYAICSVKGFLL